MKKEETIALLRTAIGQLEDGEETKALWRIVDVAGELAVRNPHAMGGLGEPTGRGFSITLGNTPKRYVDPLAPNHLIMEGR